MKKLFLILTVLAMLVSMTACGASSETATTTASTSQQGEVSTEAEASTVEWPGKNLTIYVPNKAGSNNDLTARIFATYLQTAYGTNVTVMNIGDGGGITAYEEVRNAEPDGSVLLWQHSGIVISYWTGAYDYAAVPENFTPLGWLSTAGATAYCAQADAPYDNLDEFVAYVTEHPDEVRVGVKLGNSTHLSWCRIEDALDIKVKMVDGSDDASRLAGLLGDNMDIGSMNVNTAAQYVETGDLKIIFTSIPYEDYQNCSEWNDGALDFLSGAGTILWGPSNMDSALIAQINSVMEDATQDETVIENLTSLGQIVGFSGYEEVTAFIESENEAQRAACTAAGLNVRD